MQRRLRIDVIVTACFMGACCASLLCCSSTLMRDTSRRYALHPVLLVCLANAAVLSKHDRGCGGAEREAMLKMYGMAMEALNLDQRPTEDFTAGGADLMGGADGPAAEAAALEGARRDLLTYDGCAPCVLGCCLALSRALCIAAERGCVAGRRTTIAVCQ